MKVSQMVSCSCLSDESVQVLKVLLFQANDAYLQMAIGNAPWPIGVTMVGIHARTGREKIFSKHVAHVLNDETQRKYIQVRATIMLLELSLELSGVKKYSLLCTPLLTYLFLFS